MSIYADAYIKRLLNGGWDYLNEGKYSTVLQHRDFPYLVRKVLNSKTDPYIQFIRWSINNSDIHLPKVMNILDTPKVFAVDIEKLECMDESCEYENNILNYLECALSGSIVPPSIDKDIPDTLKTTAKKMYSTFRNKFVADIHEANVMYRNNIPVITDPYCPRNI